MKWEELAYSLLEARPNDAVKLALAVALLRQIINR